MTEPLKQAEVEAPEEAERSLTGVDIDPASNEIKLHTFRTSRLIGSHPNLIARDATLETCDLRNSALMDLRASRVVLRDCQLLGVDVSGATLRDLVCINCQIKLGRAFGVKFERCWFENCDLRETEFEESRFERIAFRGCDLRQARLLRSPLRHVDFRGSRVEGIAVGPEELLGAVITPDQADTFAAAMGLRVLPMPDETAG
ncbi:MAG: pentapeptide repeat-containing protein [Phycisphaera sp.]|nr:MAG: pentapeptide repeat-containing protein [Phycisphaera sp.]